MSDTATTRDLLRQASEPHPPPPWSTPVALVCLVAGAALFIAGAIVAPGWAWGAFLANFLFWTGLSQASVVVAAVFELAPSRWGRLFQRMAVGLSAFLPLSLPLLAVVWIGRAHLYWWVGGGHGHPWLRTGNLFARDGLAILLLMLPSLWFVALSMRRDLGGLGGTWRGGGRLGALLTRGWQGDAEEQARIGRLLRNLAPVILIGYAFLYSLLAIDLAQSLVPALHSTMYPGIYFIGEFYAALAATALLGSLWCGRAALGPLLAPRQTLDLGNLVWAFAIYWAYVSWSQYLVMWFGNLPEEAGFIARRYRFAPWHGLAWAALLITFLVPFATLFSVPFKRRIRILAAIAGGALLGILLQRFLDVMPFVPAVEPLVYSLFAVGVTLGFGGLVALAYLWLMRRVPLFPVADPLFAEAVALREVEV